MQSTLKQLKVRIEASSKNQIARGELWLGTELLSQVGLRDTLENHFQVADRLNHAMVCLPVSNASGPKPALGYRYFDCSHIKRAVDVYERPIFAVVDGPFQELVNRMGLMEVLTGWATDRDAVVKAYKVESEKTLALISEVIEYPISAVVITDDFASDGGPFINRLDIDTLCSPFYTRAVQLIKESGVAVFLHSCGNLSLLIPTIKSWQIDGFAAIQSQVNDLENLYQQFDSNVMIMAGVESDLLDTAPPSGVAQKHLEGIVSALGSTGDLILSSSCGLYRKEYLGQIKKIYSIVDNFGILQKYFTLF